MSSSVLWNKGRFLAQWHKGGTYTAHERTEPRNGMTDDIRTRQFDKPENAISAAKRWERQARVKQPDDYARRERNASGLQDKDDGGDYARRRRNASGFQDEPFKRGGKA